MKKFLSVLAVVCISSAAFGQIVVLNEDLTDGSFDAANGTWVVNDPNASGSVAFRATNAAGTTLRAATAFSRDTAVVDPSSFGVGATFTLDTPLDLAGRVLEISYRAFSDLATNSGEYYKAQVGVLGTNVDVSTSFSTLAAGQQRQAKANVGGTAITTGIGTNALWNGAATTAILDGIYDLTTIYNPVAGNEASATRVSIIGNNATGAATIGAGMAPLSAVTGVQLQLLRQNTRSSNTYATDATIANAQVGFEQVVVTSWLRADFSRDGTVGSSDFSALSSNWGQSGRTWTQGDATGDGSVGSADFSILSSQWGASPAEAVAGDDRATVTVEDDGRIILNTLQNINGYKVYVGFDGGVVVNGTNALSGAPAWHPTFGPDGLGLTVTEYIPGTSIFEGISGNGMSYPANFDTGLVLDLDLLAASGAELWLATDKFGNPTQYTQIIPEPMTLSLLALGGLVAIRRRR